MKLISSTLKYFFKNFIAIALFSLPSAVFFALKLNSTSFYLYLLNLGNLETSSFIKIYSNFTLFPSFNILVILLWALILILSFCLLFSHIERHMKYGIKSYLKSFQSINYCILVVSPAFFMVIAFEEIFAVLNTLFIKLISLSSLSIKGVLMTLMFAMLMIILFLIYSLITLWVPIKMVTGYSHRDAIRYSIRLSQGNQLRLMFGLFFPFIVTAPLMMLLKNYSQLEIINSFVYVLCYVFIIGYLAAYAMTAYFAISGTERKDIKRKIFR